MLSKASLSAFRQAYRRSQLLKVRLASSVARASCGISKGIAPLEQLHWGAYQQQIRSTALSSELKDLEFQWLRSLQLKSEKNSGNESTESKVPGKNNEEDNSDDNPSRPVREETDDETRLGEKQSQSPSAATNGAGTSVPPGGDGSESGSGSGGSSNGDDGDEPKPSLKKQKLPEVYPQMLALPIARRPLFPGFYKAVVISDDRVMKAIKEMLERQQPYIGAFLLKDSDTDTDVIHSPDEVHDVGVFAQITSAFPSKDEKTGAETMTALLYPHRRIKIDELLPPTEKKESERGKADALSEEESKASLKQVSKPERKNLQTKKRSDMVDENADEPNPTEFLKNYQVSLVNVSNLEDKEFDRKSPVINALTSEILKVFKEISQLNTMFREQIATFSASIQSATTNIFEEPARLADFAAAVSAGEEEELQDILESLDIEQRLEKSLVVLKKELMNAELQNKISKDVETKIQKRQREYYLMEQLKGIKRELGIDDGRDKLIETFKSRVEKLQLPENVQKVFDDEVNKLATLETSMSEFGVIRNYLDWITSLPWGVTSKEQYSIPLAKKILDEDHYGLKDVKDRILEFIAVGKLLGKVDGKIICFVGPPGVGKTSIGKSIARSLNRQFFRFSVGGMTDVAEIKGHRRTYIGALPGRVIQALKKCETQNPLILIDEIDKIGHGGIHGDPAAALLELLDPEQNNSFLDNYLDIPIDLSKVLFVCTANSLETIPRPLLDRMEIIELTGYVAEEKIKIAEQYLSPSAKRDAGLENAHVDISEDAIVALMKYYCRESGVRNLKKHIEKVYRKAALNVVKQLKIDDNPVNSVYESNQRKGASAGQISKGEVVGSTESLADKDGKLQVEKTHDNKEALVVPEDIEVSVNADNLKDYVGPPIYTSDRLYDTTPPGVVMGLAWTSMGGCSMYVESVLEQPITDKSVPSLERTGQLGDVMKESSRLAYSFARMFLTKKFPENRFFEKAAIHVHCPEGATPKDGPSAGVTMASSFLSLALNQSLEPTVAMTGELTLTGKVLRIGGLREKAVAARRSGAKTIIFPKDNMNDWADLPDHVKEGLEPLAADWYDQIFDRLFSDVSKEAGNSVWRAEFDKIDAKEAKNKS
ncbi:LAQU0S02e08306g1_1 [Lachancea quebecensis]|uniref:Lon protease homolog, mitochondrial n=1 Tax=Lachancea quebecensis TaxID=1654605 RepID=A0A0P1KN02_9SACH|nr:LAQU0S02e08306g1_1 [Lachancea quebecensis]